MWNPHAYFIQSGKCVGNDKVWDCFFRFGKINFGKPFCKFYWCANYLLFTPLFSALTLNGFFVGQNALYGFHAKKTQLFGVTGVHVWKYISAISYFDRETLTERISFHNVYVLNAVWMKHCCKCLFVNVILSSNQTTTHSVATVSFYYFILRSMYVRQCLVLHFRTLELETNLIMFQCKIIIIYVCIHIRHTHRNGSTKCQMKLLDKCAGANEIFRTYT